MFSTVVQAGPISLFSSTGSDPLQLFSVHTDASLPSDSIIHLLIDTTSEPAPPSPALMRPLPSAQEDAASSKSADYSLDQTVLHIQSPALRDTFIRCPPLGIADLGIKHPWMHLQVRDLGKDWSFEVGLVDKSGHEGIVRCSTFQKRPRLDSSGSRPLLHLPLSFPSESTYRLTTWSTIALRLPSLVSNHFTSGELDNAEDGQQHRSRGYRFGGAYSHVCYFKIYASCRLRRVWFSEDGPNQKFPWEFELYGT